MNATTTEMTYGARTFDPEQLLAQIGRRNVLAISGGRVRRIDSGIRLPVRYGYRVDVLLADDDTYTVRRVFTRAGDEFVHAELTGVHAEDVGEAAYRASCYNDPFPVR